MPSLTKALSLFSLLSRDLFPSKPATIPNACNGQLSYCDMKWSEVSQIGTHDSPFDALVPSANQDFTVANQMNAGIRFLQAQSHFDDGELKMCHTSCGLFNAGPVKDYFKTVREFLDTNPREVVTLLITNPDGASIAKYDGEMKSAGLDKYAYIPPKKLAINEWPTLRQMIKDNKRLVMFMDFHADPSFVPYILPEFDYFFETKFENTDSDFTTCDLHRPGNSKPDGKMYIVNHWVQANILGALVPNELLMFRTNAATGKGSIGEHADLCKRNFGRYPKAVLVDRFNRGDVFPAQDKMNGVKK